jgi:hypothetical protein
MKTLVARGHREFAGQAYHHGSEIPPDVLPKEVVARWLDWHWLIEMDSTERRSLHRLLPQFSGSSESEPLDGELKEFAI